MLTLKRWMSRELVTVPQDTTLLTCARIMARDGYRHLPVVDEHGRLTGVVNDVALFALELTFDPWRLQPAPGVIPEAELPAFFLAVPPDVVAGVGAPLIPALHRLAGSLDDTVIVIDKERRPVGIFTEHDAAVRAAERLRASMTTEWLTPRRLISVQARQPISTAWAKMEAARVRHVLVYEGDTFTGVLSMRDLAFNGRCHNRDGTPGDPGDRPTVGALVKRLPLTTPVGTPLRSVARTMASQRIGCVPVLQDGEVVQVITRSDLCRALASALEDEAFFDTNEVSKFTAMMG